MTDGRHPYFALIGAQRCGTTFIASQLKQFPNVLMAEPSSPEPKYFIGDRYGSMDHYLSTYFGSRSDGQILGDKSTSYIEFPDQVIPRMLECFPDARIVVSLRDPVERALSNYFFSKKHGYETRSLEQVFIEDVPPPTVAGEVSVNPFDYLKRGHYASYLQPFLDAFGSDRMHLMCYEEFTTDPAPFTELARFVGCDSPYIATDYQPVNQAERTEVVSDEVRRVLSAYYEPLHVELERQQGRSFDRWT